MKIRDVFFKSYKNFIVSILLGITCLIVITMTVNDVNKYNMFSLCFPVEYPWQYFSGIFVHGTPQFPIVASIAHLLFNMLLIIPFGILVEKVVGSNRFSLITIISWIVQAIAFYMIASMITPENEIARGAGISGIAFMYGTIGAYVLYGIFKLSKKGFFKQILTYIYLNILIAMLILLNPFVAGVSSFIIHIIGVLIGILFVILNHRFIISNIEMIFRRERLRLSVSRWNYVWIIVPVFFVTIYIIY